eukprot:TRINITY_DN5704_c0_g1_i2.p1 TRINITY_DN5704_c0_g1~~TRINITY_DN5704_c0_g1_i2.p1  ORF type:complete len:221 (-),score=21.95 TRINITY_DN5704_c0_g1_i2:34-696(-)
MKVLAYFIANAVVSFLINFLINGAIGSLVFYRKKEITMWTNLPTAMGLDIVAMCVFGGAVTWIIGGSLSVRDARTKPWLRVRAPLWMTTSKFLRVEDLTLFNNSWGHRFLRALKRGLMLSAMVLIVFGFTPLFVLTLIDKKWAYREVILFKALFAAILALLITPLVAFIAVSRADKDKPISLLSSDEINDFDHSTHEYSLVPIDSNNNHSSSDSESNVEL